MVFFYLDAPSLCALCVLAGSFFWQNIFFGECFDADGPRVTGPSHPLMLGRNSIRENLLLGLTSFYTMTLTRCYVIVAPRDWYDRGLVMPCISPMHDTRRSSIFIPYIMNVESELPASRLCVVTSVTTWVFCCHCTACQCLASTSRERGVQCDDSVPTFNEKRAR